MRCFPLLHKFEKQIVYNLKPVQSQLRTIPSADNILIIFSIISIFTIHFSIIIQNLIVLIYEVYAYAKIIGECEGLSEEEQKTVETAALVHDIACPLCRKK